MRLGVAFFGDASDELREFSEVAHLFGFAGGVLAAGRRQYVNARAVEKFFLRAEFAFALGELLVGMFAVEGDNVRGKLFKLLRKDDAAFGEILALQFLDALCGALDEVSEADAELDDALVVVVVERLGDDAAIVKNGPELIGTTGVIMADTDRGFAGIATNDDEFHALAEVVGKCAHGVRYGSAERPWENFKLYG